MLEKIIRVDVRRGRIDPIRIGAGSAVRIVVFGIQPSNDDLVIKVSVDGEEESSGFAATVDVERVAWEILVPEGVISSTGKGCYELFLVGDAGSESIGRGAIEVVPSLNVPDVDHDAPRPKPVQTINKQQPDQRHHSAWRNDKEYHSV